MGLDVQKRLAAEYSASLVTDGMTVGLGSGTTAEMAVEILGHRFREGLKFVGVRRRAGQPRSHNPSASLSGASTSAVSWISTSTERTKLTQVSTW